MSETNPKPTFWQWLTLLLAICNALLIALVIGITTRAKEQPPCPPPPPGNMPPPIEQQLGLNPTQASQFQGLVQAHRHTADSLRSAEMGMRTAYFTSIANPALRQTATDSLLNQLQNCHIALEKATYLHFKAVYALLNDHQKAQFPTLIKQRAQQHGRHEPPPHPPLPPPQQ